MEPWQVLPALRGALEATGRYRFLPGREVRAAEPGVVRDDHGISWPGDAVIICPGAWLAGLMRELAPDLPVQRVRLQMLQTEPLGEPLATSVADADGLRYYPAFRGRELDLLNTAEPQAPVAAAHRMQLLMVQRADGGLTVGDTHAYREPFPFDLVEEPYDHLHRVAGELLGRPLPPTRRRWSGVYAQCTDPAAIVFRRQVADRVWLVTGPGGRGMTLSPAIAAATADAIGL